MPLTERLGRFLAHKEIPYRTVAIDRVASFEALAAASAQASDLLIRASLLIDKDGAVMAVHQSGSGLDLDSVHAVTGRRLQMLSECQAGRLLADCEPGFVPPIGSAYGLPVVVDDDVLQAPRVLFSGGTGDSLVGMDSGALRLALPGARSGRLVVRGHSDAARELLTLDQVAARLQKLYRLPPMPALALRLLRLTANNEATARELAELIEYDPSLTAQVMRYARSALFNYPGQINSVQEAVTRVLGFERVAHIALGIAAVRAFEVPRQGALGMDSFWRHSLHCAFLCQSLAPHCGADKGLAYLCGMLHNFGLLLIGHLLPTEFAELNKLREANPEASMQALERQVFGQGSTADVLAVGHGTIGSVLHRLWQLPGPVITAAGMHQQPSYGGEHACYVRMVQLANALLKRRGIGDELNPDDLAARLGALDLPETIIDELDRDMDRISPELDALAKTLSS